MLLNNILFTVLFISICFDEVSSYVKSRFHQKLEFRNKLNANIGGDRWSDFKGFDCKVLGPVTVLNHLGDYQPFQDKEIDHHQSDFNLNVGKALETLRRELPVVFYVSNLDFSIFANQITVADGNNQNKILMQKTLYTTAVKSLRMASSLSFICPSMNVKKIEYIENCRTIQCLVDVVLPDTVRIDGQSVWEGMFYFGLDNAGLINSHIFDRKISNHRTSTPAASVYPWFGNPVWNGGFEPVKGLAFPKPTLAVSQTDSVEEQV